MAPRPTVRVVPGNRLTDEECARWGALQDADARLASPFLSPDFTRCVADAWPGVFVAVLECGDRQVGFFPFERIGTTGYPVGRRWASQQGAVLAAGIRLNAVALVRACGLREWRFTHVPTTQVAFAPFDRGAPGAPYADLRHGYAAYLDDLRARHHKTVSDTARRGRKLAREVGPLRFVVDDEDRGMVSLMVLMKRSQYRETGADDPLAHPEYVHLLDRLLEHRGPRCRRTVSALYAGDRLVAGSIAVRSRGVWALLLIVHDPSLNHYSPGQLGLLSVFEAAAAEGIATVDLGRGEDDFKMRLASGTLALGEGDVTVGYARRLRRDTEAFARARTHHVLNTGGLAPGTWPGTWLRAARDRLRRPAAPVGARAISSGTPPQSSLRPPA